MNKFIFKLSRSLLGLALPLAASCAMAQSAASTDLDRVDVTGRISEPVLKFDVHKACPQIGAQLQESLERHLGRYASPGQTMRVEFQLSGKEISAVRTGPGLALFGQPIKKAVRRLSCESAQAGPERYAFLLVVLDPDAVRDEAAVAQQGLNQPLPLLVTAR